MRRIGLHLASLLSILAAACGGTPTPESQTVDPAGPHSAEDPVLAGAPCADATRTLGFEVAERGREDRTVSVYGVLTTEHDAALCPNDGLVPEDGFALVVEAHAANLELHVLGVESEGNVLALTAPGGVSLVTGQRFRLPEDAGREMMVFGDPGTDYVVFIVSQGPLADRDPELAALVASVHAGTANAEQVSLRARGDVVVDGPGHRVDGAGDVVVVPFPVQHRPTGGRTRGVIWADPIIHADPATGPAGTQ